MKKTVLIGFLSLLFHCLATLCHGAETKAELTGPEIWENIFVPQLHKKFHQQIESTYKFENLVSQKKGRIVLDHAATRTADPETYAFITRLAEAFGLKPNGHYTFPEKRLSAIDYQLKGKNSFKWFSTLIHYDEFTPFTAELVKEDIRKTQHTLSENGLALLEKLESTNKLSQSEALALVTDIIYNFCSRNGPPLKEKTIKMISRESPETANALLLGPDFNHIAYSLNDLDIQEWYGMEVITVLEKLLRQEGFEMLPKIQGEPGSTLRQTSTKADFMSFDFVDENDQVTPKLCRSKFIEFIQRYPEQDSEGRIVFDGNEIKPFLGFLASNAYKIYESTN